MVIAEVANEAAVMIHPSGFILNALDNPSHDALNMFTDLVPFFSPSKNNKKRKLAS